MPSAPNIKNALRRDVTVSSQVRVRVWSWTGVFPQGGPPGAHPGVELSWIERGNVLYRMEGREFRAGPGDVVVIPAGVEHETIFLSDVEAGALWLARERVGEIAEAMGPAVSRRGMAPAVLRDASRVVPLARVLRAEIEEAGAGHLLAVDALAEALSVEMLRAAPARAAPASAKDPRLDSALELVHASYARPLTVAEMAGAAKMSRFHFSRAFRDAVGESPYQYLSRVRLARASEMLRRGHHSVTEAAIAVGMPDLGRFSRAFRRAFGCRPHEIARHRASSAALQ
jgi:AraC-like DNA-binding protein